jgi:hypothetical protein
MARMRQLPLVLVSVLLAALAAVVRSRRLPRGFTPALYCAACHSVASEIRSAHEAGSASETIDAGSFRLSESGKQLARTQVPLRRSEFHAVATLDTACAEISSRYVLPTDSVLSGPFVPKALRDERGLSGANFTDDCGPVRALRALCSQLVDEHEEALKDRLKSGDLHPDAWADELCGSSGIATACDQASEPKDMETILGIAKEQLDAHKEYQAVLAAEKEARQLKENASMADSRTNATSGLSDNSKSEMTNVDKGDIISAPDGFPPPIAQTADTRVPIAGLASANDEL